MADEERALAPRARLGVGAAVVLMLVALAVTIGVGVWRSASAPAWAVEDPVPTVAVTADASSAEQDDLYVHVHGAVRDPGLYLLPSDARLVDALSAAGGAADDADVGAINLARLVKDGEQIRVPRAGEAAVEESAPPSGLSAPGETVIDINTADAAALDTLPRVGPAIAQRIVAWREENGAFTNVEDLLAVSGIGDKMLEQLRPLVTV